MYHSFYETQYEARNYTAAILDAIHFLSDLIRECAGLEGDGVALVGEGGVEVVVGLLELFDFVLFFPIFDVYGRYRLMVCYRW